MKADAIVIGGGTNGLACACFLARAGRAVVVVERREKLGGLAAEEEFHPGFRSPGTLLDTSRVRPWVARELELEQHGLRWRDAEPSVLLVDEERPGLVLYADDARTRAELALHAPRDAEQWDAFRALIRRYTSIVRRLLDRAPPDLDPASAGEMWELASTGIALRLLGARAMTELIRIAPISLSDWLAEHFESERLKAGLAGPALEGTWMGPRSAGGTFAFLARECLRARSVAGGPQMLVDALASAARAAGVELRTASAVQRIRAEGERVRGVELDSGESIEAALVASSIGPKRTLLELLPRAALAPSVVSAARAIRCRGGIARVDVALSGPIEYAGRPGERFELARTGARLDDLERAFDALKYRRASERPWLEVHCPTIARPELAPAGQHLLSILVHNAPHELEGGWTEAARTALARRALDELARHAPSVRDQIIATRMRTPDVLATELALDGGHLHHAELALDQALFLRPIAACGHYATPVEGLYLCGSGSHPGGGLTCAPGSLAARAMLAR